VCERKEVTRSFLMSSRSLADPHTKGDRGGEEVNQRGGEIVKKRRREESRGARRREGRRLREEERRREERKGTGSR
jgi:hypothetical protein